MPRSYDENERSRHGAAACRFPPRQIGRRLGLHVHSDHRKALDDARDLRPFIWVLLPAPLYQVRHAGGHVHGHRRAVTIRHPLGIRVCGSLMLSRGVSAQYTGNIGIVIPVCIQRRIMSVSECPAGFTQRAAGHTTVTQRSHDTDRRRVANKSYTWPMTGCIRIPNIIPGP